MKQGERQTRSHLVRLFEQCGVSPRKQLGQNFLIDLNLIEYIAREAQLEPRDVVLEVGAGTGSLTTLLAEGAGEVVSVEVDAGMIPLVQAAIAGRTNVTLLNCDALQNKNHLAPEVLQTLDEKLRTREDARLKLVANLPYSVATPVISNLIATDLPWTRMVVTIQFELAQRMFAKAGSSHYSGLSAWVRSQCRVKILKRLPPAVFWPRPKVMSAIVEIVPDPRARDTIDDRAFFQDFLRRLFQQRRKLLRGVLAGQYREHFSKDEIDALLQEVQLTGSVRAEELEPRVLVQLSNRIRAELIARGATGPGAAGAETSAPLE